ncbi:hypothetical protein SBA3_1340019 [Candidatus Sulfopaludibacter sp. SbA3]|nr:hypothetical protein SBA3_1340019 [Candidatus Sulfopaludibacter sp. SbA3]
MSLSVAEYRAEHRELERALDNLLHEVSGAAPPFATFCEARALAGAHYAREAPLLETCGIHLAVKIAAQHEEALELAQRAAECWSEGHTRDAVNLMRRFQALAQHNIIEEERDLFPLVELL